MGRDFLVLGKSEMKRLSIGLLMASIMAIGCAIAQNPFIAASRAIKGEPVDNAFKLSRETSAGPWVLELALFSGKVSFPYLYIKKFSGTETDFRGFKLEQLYSGTKTEEGRTLAKVPFTETEILSAGGRVKFFL